MSEDKLKATRGIANVEQTRSWNTEEYKKRALEREDRERNGGARSTSGASPKKDEFLTARDKVIDFTKNVGTVKMINAESAATGKAGFFCKVCDAGFQDSTSYMVHLNSQRHQSKLGLSLEVERSSVDAVKDRLRQKLENTHEEVGAGKKKDADYDFEKRVKELEEEEEAKQIERLEKKKKRQEEKKKKEEEEAAALTDMETMAMMGFGSFGGSKKKR